jgi:pimeloyl-ACP methyl ester carboxylesterase
MAVKYAAFRDALASLAFAEYPINDYRRTRLVTLAQAPEYSADERRRLSAAETGTFSVLYPQLLALHLDREVPALEVPAYFVLGRHDMSVGADAARRYYEALRAPRKGLVWFEQSGRSPMHEEPDRFLQVMVGTVVPESSSRDGQTH